MVREELILFILFSIALASHALKCYQCESYRDPKKHGTSTASTTISVTTKKGIEETEEELADEEGAANEGRNANKSDKNSGFNADEEDGMKKAIQKDLKNEEEDDFLSDQDEKDNEETKEQVIKKEVESDEEDEYEEEVVKVEVKEAKPFCDPHLWRRSNRTVRRMMESHCPKDRGSFCSVEVTQLENGTVYTARGCVGNYDASGLAIGYGCVFGERSTICTCDTDICNSAPARHPLPALLAAAAIYYVFNWF